jgi:hypothetical protein
MIGALYSATCLNGGPNNGLVCWFIQGLNRGAELA